MTKGSGASSLPDRHEQRNERKSGSVPFRVASRRERSRAKSADQLVAVPIIPDLAVETVVDSLIDLHNLLLPPHARRFSLSVDNRRGERPLGSVALANHTGQLASW